MRGHLNSRHQIILEDKNSNDIIKENGNLDQNDKCRNDELRRKLLEMSVQNAVLQHNIQTLKSELEQHKSNK